MPQQKTPLFSYTSQLLSVPHAMFTCAGGTSTAPYSSLNLSYHVGDQVEQVGANRSIALAALGLRQLVSAHQIHSDRILLVEKHHAGTEVEGYDALISSLPDTGLLIQQADCQTVLLSAPQAGLVAAIHCGWQGSVLNIIGKTIQCLVNNFDLRADNLLAAISPSLGPCCAECIHYRKELPKWMHAYQVQQQHFDFWAISRRQLLDAGVLPEHIDVVALCTRCQPQFFSYRRASKINNGITGRNGTIIGLAAIDER